jgi:F-type H+-transporting ATPase subunit epsilon
MSGKIIVDLVTPSKQLLSEEADMVVVPGIEGDMGVLTGHAPLVSLMRPGVVTTYQNDNEDKKFFAAGGFIEVTGKRCTVLAEEMDELSSLNKADAEKKTCGSEKGF